MAFHRIAWLCLALAVCAGEPGSPPLPPLPPAADMARDISELRVMSYNVKGLPWPFAVQRKAALDAIGMRLAAMRKADDHPQIVVLQEAFLDDAKRIGRLGGYRHLAFGAGPATAAILPAPPIGGRYASQASWLKGEDFGPVLDSGLALFSDYPIERIERLTFPQGACAGYDCLASKGVLIAWIRLPGRREPLAVATTHLNSLNSSGVPEARSNAAFAWQYGSLHAFARSRIGGDQAAIVAGDFNLGGDVQRFATADRIGAPLSRAHDAVGETLARDAVAMADRAEARAVSARRTDRQYYRSGRGLTLQPTGIEIPFPMTGAARPLSDHPGVMVGYAINGSIDEHAAMPASHSRG